MRWDGTSMDMEARDGMGCDAMQWCDVHGHMMGRETEACIRKRGKRECGANPARDTCLCPCSTHACLCRLAAARHVYAHTAPSVTSQHRSLHIASHPITHVLSSLLSRSAHRPSPFHSPCLSPPSPPHPHPHPHTQSQPHPRAHPLLVIACSTPRNMSLPLCCRISMHTSWHASHVCHMTGVPCYRCRRHGDTPHSC